MAKVRFGHLLHCWAREYKLPRNRTKYAHAHKEYGKTTHPAGQKTEAIGLAVKNSLSRTILSKCVKEWRIVSKLRTIRTKQQRKTR